MGRGQANCVYRGRPFTGLYEVNGEGVSQAVHVHYNGSALEARTGGLPVETVAGALLKDLVAWEKMPTRAPDYRGPAKP